MNLKIAAMIFGIFFIFVGVAGFMPLFTKNDLLFNLFMVDTAHNIIHLISGFIALLCAFKTKISLYYFRVFGVIYAIVAIAGFITHDLVIIHVNLADNLLHIAIAAISLFLGFFHRKIHLPPVA